MQIIQYSDVDLGACLNEAFKEGMDKSKLL